MIVREAPVGQPFTVEGGVKLKVGELLLVREVGGADRFIVRVTAVNDRRASVEEVARARSLDKIEGTEILDVQFLRFDVEGLRVEPLDDPAPWIAALGADDFATRERATARLTEAGESARGAVEAAGASADPEMAARAKRILAKLRSPVDRLGVEALAELFRGPAVDD